MEPAKKISYILQNNFQKIDEKNTFVSLNLQIQNIEIDNSKNSQIIFVIDKSGSMSGKCMEVTKEFLQVSLTKIIDNNYQYVTIIPFNREAKILPIKMDKPKNEINEKLTEFINNLKAGGGTIFHKTFTAISECIEKQGDNDKNVFVVYLTDGELIEEEDFKNNYKMINDSIDILKQKIKKFTKNCEFHTIGVKKDHDPFLLEKLTNLSTGKGTYQYLEDIKDAEKIFENISLMLEGYFGNLNANLEINLNENKEIIPIEFTLDKGNSNNIVFESNTIINLDEKMLKNGKINLFVKGNEGVDSINVEPKFNVIDSETKLFVDFKIISKKMNENLTKIKENIKSVENLDSCQEDFILIRNEFYDKIKKIYSFAPSKRDPFFEKASDLQNFLNTIEKLLNSAYKQNISKNEIAEVNALAYKNIIDSKLNKKLEKRAQKSVKIINEAYLKIEDYIKTIDKEILLKKYEKEAENFGTCFLSCYNFLECIFDYDCLCVTFNVSRSELSIVNSASIKINQIFPTFISANGFMSTVKYALKISPEAGGGFDIEKKGKIVKGIAQEDINGCLPIFICKEHWEVARLIMKPVLGWVVTLDPVGYSYEQKKNVPFLLMAEIAIKKLDKKTNNEFWDKMFAAIFETCQQLLIDDEENSELDHTWKPEFREVFNNYLAKGETRTPDVVPNNKIFLMQIFCAMKIGWINTFDNVELEEFFRAMFEEELRRNQTEWDQNILNEKILNFLNIDNKTILEFGNTIISHLQTIEKKAKEENKTAEEISASLDFPSIFIDLNELFIEKNLTETHKNARIELEKILETNCQELELLKTLFAPIEPKKLTFESIGADNNLKFFCLYLQNKIQFKNSERKKVFKYGKYKFYNKIEEAKCFLDEVAQEIAKTQADLRYKWKKREFNLKKPKPNEIEILVPNVPNHNSRNSMLHGLYQTDSLKDAVDYFKTLGKTSRLFYFYWFKRYGGPKIVEKLKILMTGMYDGELVMLEWTKDNFYPKGKVLKRIYKGNKESINLVEWKKIFN